MGKRLVRAVVTSIRDALSDDPKKDWRESLSDAADALAGLHQGDEALTNKLTKKERELLVIVLDDEVHRMKTRAASVCMGVGGKYHEVVALRDRIKVA